MDNKNRIGYNFNTNQLEGINFTDVLVQGQDNDVKITINFIDPHTLDTFTDATWQVLCVFERPDGSKTNEMLATLTDEDFNITLPSWITDIEGNVKLTTTILHTDGTRQAFGLALIPVLEGVEPSTSTIEEALYDALLLTINNINAKTEARVKKAGDTMSGNLDMDGNEVENVLKLIVNAIEGLGGNITLLDNLNANNKVIKNIAMLSGEGEMGLLGTINSYGGEIKNVAMLSGKSLRIENINNLLGAILILANLDLDGNNLENVNAVNTDKLNAIDGEVTVDGDFKMTGHKVYDAGHVDIDKGVQDTLTTAKSVKDYAVHRKLTIGDVEFDKAINFLNSISSAEITQTLNEATENMQGALCADDKKFINRLRDLLDVDQGFVDTLQEVLDVFTDYPHSTDLLTMFAKKVDTKTKINDIEIGIGMTIKSKDVPFSTTTVEAELERLEGAKVDIRGDADLMLNIDKAKVDKLRDDGEGDEFLNDKQEYQVIKANQVKTSLGGTYEGKGVEEALDYVKLISGVLILDFGYFTDDEESVPIFDLGGFI